MSLPLVMIFPVGRCLSCLFFFFFAHTNNAALLFYVYHLVAVFWLFFSLFWYSVESLKSRIVGLRVHI
jgi:hypothetical protein